MKHLNQINAALVIIGLAMVFYSLSQTFFNEHGNLVRIVSNAEAPMGGEVANERELTPPEARTPRNRPSSTARPSSRETNNAPSRRPPLGGSPQLAGPGDEEVDPTAPTESRTRVLTTPTPRPGRSNREDSTARPTPNPDQSSEFMEAVERLRRQQEQGERPAPTRPGAPPRSSQEEGRRRQAEPPPARSSMADRRPPL